MLVYSALLVQVGVGFAFGVLCVCGWFVGFIWISEWVVCAFGAVGVLVIVVAGWDCGWCDVV